MYIEMPTEKQTKSNQYAIVPFDHVMCLNARGKRRKVRCACTDGMKKLLVEDTERKYFYWEHGKFDSQCPDCGTYYYFKD